MTKATALAKRLFPKWHLWLLLFFADYFDVGFAAQSLIRVNKEKLTAVAYENDFFNDKMILKSAYGKAVGFAGSLRNISLDPKRTKGCD